MKINKRIWFICWAFGAMLTILSFLIAINPNDRWMIYVGIIFLIIHTIGFYKYNKKPLHHKNGE